MNELIINVTQTPGMIAFNLDELKKSLSAEMDGYRNLVVTEDSLKADKKDLAMLRRARKELNDTKIEIKNAFMMPYTRFEDEVKEALKLINEPIAIIDAQVKEFEARQKEEKKAHCREIYNEAVGDFAEYLPFEKCFSDDWLKASAKDKDVRDDIDGRIIRVKNDLNAIKALNSEIEAEILNAYKKTGELSAAIQKNTDYLNAKSLAEKRLDEKRVEERESDLWVLRKAEPDSIKAMVTFAVSREDADKVREYLIFAGIEYEED